MISLTTKKRIVIYFIIQIRIQATQHTKCLRVYDGDFEGGRTAAGYPGYKQLNLRSISGITNSMSSKLTP
jgi:hypothetical protein